MTKQKRKLIATFKGLEAEAFANDIVELTGKSRLSMSYIWIEETV